MKKVLIFFLPLLLLTYCFNPEKIYREPSSIRDLNSSDILVVGRIIFDPPITPREQRFHIDGVDILGSQDDLEKNNRQAVNLSIDTELPQKEKVKKHAKLLDYYSKNIFRTKDNKFFYLQYKQEPFYIVNGRVLLDYVYGKAADNRWMQGQSSVTYGESIQYMLFPIRALVDVKSKEQAVYVGSLKVKRNEDNKILSVELIDEYEEALKDFKVNYGDRPLGKSMMKIVNE